jgi:hypothetical protein
MKKVRTSVLRQSRCKRRQGVVAHSPNNKRAGGAKWWSRIECEYFGPQIQRQVHEAGEKCLTSGDGGHECGYFGPQIERHVDEVGDKCHTYGDVYNSSLVVVTPLEDLVYKEIHVSGDKSKATVNEEQPVVPTYLMNHVLWSPGWFS